MYDTYVVDDAEQVRAWDEQTLHQEAISSLVLMERAATAVCRYFEVRYPVATYSRIDILCGPGNNGGDGAAIARLLEDLGYEVHVWGWWTDVASRSSDLKRNWQRLLERSHPRLHTNEDYVPTPNVDVIVDALFGVGLTRPLTGAFAKTVQTVNAYTGLADRVSIDVPSGQRIDGAAPDWPCVEATKTVTFEALKQAALLPETGKAWGSIQIEHLDLVEPPNWVTEQTPRIMDRDFLVLEAGDLLGSRERFTHKGTYGHVLVLAGSRGHAGAALLAGKGAYHAGCGLVTFYAPHRLETMLQVGLPEAMSLVDSHPDHLTSFPDLRPYDAVVVGPGIGQHPDTAAMLHHLFAQVGERALVVDADALNLLAQDTSLAAKLPPHAILTPHPGEFARLVGPSDSGYERLQQLKAYAKRMPEECVVVLKGQYTAVASGDGRLAFNFFHGNPGMASGGMGDLLAGCLAGLVARAESSFGACCVGVYAHAKAGDVARDEYGESGVLASYVAERLGEQFD